MFRFSSFSFLLIFSTFLVGAAKKEDQEETKSLKELYESALKEGGKLTVYGGGDSPDQLDSTKSAFESAFANISVDFVVDYSKFHDARLDLQIANNSLIPDVIHFQTVQDFPRWKKEGILLQYKPRGWEKVFPEFKDSDGFYTGFQVAFISNVVNSQLVPNESDWPKVATDYLRPEFGGGKLAFTYPNDDDAFLFLFKQLIDKYGWKWFAQLVQTQKPIFARGGPTPLTFIYNGSAAATLSFVGASMNDASSPARFSFPADDDPFMTWSQQAAILKKAKHPEAAKLYLNWQLENAKNTSSSIWSVRTDTKPAKGFKQIWEYPNSSHKKFAKFMENREAAELFRTQIMLYIGEPKGPPAAGVLGPNPTKSCVGQLENCEQ